MSDPRAMPFAGRQSQVPIMVSRQGTLNARQIIPDPAEKFVLDRFGWMTKNEQDTMLRGLLPTGLDALVTPPRESAYCSGGYGATTDQDSDFSELNPLARSLIVQLIAEGDAALRSRATECSFDSLREQMPAIGYALAHIYEGGFFGLLTARGARSAHAVQLGIIGEVLGFIPDPGLVYFTTDEVLSSRLEGSTAQRKSIVLRNLFNGVQRDEEGRLSLMKLGRFDEVIFIDDEATNQREVMQIVVRGVCEGVLREFGMMRICDPALEELLDSLAQGLVARAFEVAGVAPLHSDNFWGYVIGRILDWNGGQELSGYPTNREVIHQLRARKEWVPDLLKVLDPATIDSSESEDRLRRVFSEGSPLTCGTKRSLVMLDIDGTLLQVDARVYIRSKSHPEMGILGAVDQASFARDPDATEAISRVAQDRDLPVNDLELCFMDFRDEARIRLSLLRALITGTLTRKK